MNRSNFIRFNLNELDPDKVQNDERFPKKFCVEVNLFPL